MEKKLIGSLQEYREHTFSLCNEGKNNTLMGAFGIYICNECWEFSESGEPLDENGNIIPEDTAATMQIEDWVAELTFPIILLTWLENGSDRIGNYGIVCVETVQLSEFTTTIED